VRPGEDKEDGGPNNADGTVSSARSGEELPTGEQQQPEGHLAPLAWRSKARHTSQPVLPNERFLSDNDGAHIRRPLSRSGVEWVANCVDGLPDRFDLVK
jgi:hypothetical protein